jgi:hypothetical protein
MDSSFSRQSLQIPESTSSSVVNTPTTAKPSKTINSYQTHTRSKNQGQGSASRSRPTTPVEAAHKPPHTSGLRAQLHHLLPRHALFHVQVQIHQISSVPLLHGEFAVRWKFKHVHSPPPPSARSGVFPKAKAGSSKGKEKAGGDVEDSDDGHDGHDGSTLNSVEDSVPSVVVSRDSHSPISTTGSSSRAPSKFDHYLTADWLPHSLLSSASSPSVTPADTPSLSHTPIENYAQARGRTEFIKLKDHGVSWEHVVDVVVRMDIDRDTCDLLPNELKLVVMQVSACTTCDVIYLTLPQRVIPGDPDAPHNPRLGALYLNLAEYASSGAVTRRYLLRESKTNATLKVRFLAFAQSLTGSSSP